MPNTQNRRRWARASATLTAVVLAVGGAVAVGVGLAAQEPAPPAPPQVIAAAARADRLPAGGVRQGDGRPAGRANSGSDRPGRGDDRAGTERLSLGYSPPVRIEIPSIGVSSSLVDLFLDDNGVMQTPKNPDVAGWFAPSPAPGVPGATVIAGHVTWNQRPTVFFRLGALRPGDRVQVRRRDGITTVFEVTRIGSFPKSAFPTRVVYNQPGRPELRLITCGGKYDGAQHRYLDNVIVWAKLVDVRRPA